jgi:hypothetical protein
MGIEIRLPQITGATEREQLQQLKSYIYQLREQLQWAFENISTTGGAGNGQYVVSQSPIFTRPSGGSSSNAEVTFNEIKSLIIKSADIVDAYYEEISNRLEGLYVAQSDFGVYVERTSQRIDETSVDITRSFENTQVIIRDTVDVARAEASAEIIAAKSEVSDEINGAKGELDGKIDDVSGRIDETNSAVENLGAGLDDVDQRIDSTEEELQSAKENIKSDIQRVTNSLSKTDKMLESAKAQLEGSIDDLEFILKGLREIIVGVAAYVKSGLLYDTEAGIPVYGIEIGQEVEANGEKVFNKFSRFTSEKLSFYDNNGNEVAYISDKKLYIGQAEITISLQVGGLVDLVMANGDVVTKWVGKE